MGRQREGGERGSEGGRKFEDDKGKEIYKREGRIGEKRREQLKG